MKNNVIFTQNNNKFHKIIRSVCVYGYPVLLICHFIHYFGHLITSFRSVDYWFLIFSIVLHGFILWLMYYFLSSYIEEFYIYEDRIESVTCHRIVRNRVYFKDLREIKEVKLMTGKVIYIFDDGRKDGLFNICKFTQLNNLRYNLRIHKTEELEQFIFRTLASKVSLYDGMEV